MRYRVLASDYDGTLADGSVANEATLAALQRWRGVARRLILVTGRELTDLARVMPRLNLFDLVAAENGAPLHDPDNHVVLGDAVPPAFATTSPHDAGVADLIDQLLAPDLCEFQASLDRGQGALVANEHGKPLLCMSNEV